MRLQLSMWLVGTFVEKATQISFQRIPQKYTSLDVRCLQVALSLIAVGGRRTREVDAVPLHVLTMCRSPHFGATLLVHTNLHGGIRELKVVPSPKQTCSNDPGVSNQSLEPPRPLFSEWRIRLRLQLIQTRQTHLETRFIEITALVDQIGIGFLVSLFHDFPSQSLLGRRHICTGKRKQIKCSYISVKRVSPQP